MVSSGKSASELVSLYQSNDITAHITDITPVIGFEVGHERSAPLHRSRSVRSGLSSTGWRSQVRWVVLTTSTRSDGSWVWAALRVKWAAPGFGGFSEDCVANRPASSSTALCTICARWSSWAPAGRIWPPRSCPPPSGKPCSPCVTRRCAESCRRCAYPRWSAWEGWRSSGRDGCCLPQGWVCESRALCIRHPGTHWPTRAGRTWLELSWQNSESCRCWAAANDLWPESEPELLNNGSGCEEVQSEPELKRLLTHFKRCV